MTKVQQGSRKQNPLYREVAHDYPFLWWILAFAIFVSLLIALSLCTANPQDEGWRLLITIPAIIGAMVMIAYFLSFPIAVEVTKIALVLRRGSAGSLRDRSFPIASIHALRYIAYSKELHGGIDVRGADLERWNMGGDRVLEIELKDADRVHLVSPRGGELAALLHEMTRVPLEDCR